LQELGDRQERVSSSRSLNLFFWVISACNDALNCFSLFWDTIHLHTLSMTMDTSIGRLHGVNVAYRTRRCLHYAEGRQMDEFHGDYDPAVLLQDHLRVDAHTPPRPCVQDFKGSWMDWEDLGGLQSPISEFDACDQGYLPILI